MVRQERLEERGEEEAEFGRVDGVSRVFVESEVY